jgi:glycopeptide antibiotics resistance protein
MKARKFSRVFLWTAFVFYVCVVFGILFLGGRQGRFPYGSLSEYIRHSVNPIPFKTIFGYVRDVMENRWMLGLAVKNVFGNFILFYPMGVFLPCLFKGARTAKKTLLIALCTILSVETVQIIFRLGIFDIDDLLLNVAGWILGFITISIPFIRECMGKIYFLED